MMRGSWSPKLLSSIGVAQIFPSGVSSLEAQGLLPRLALASSLEKEVTSILKAKATPASGQNHISDKGFEVNKVLKVSPNNGACLLELLTAAYESVS